MILGYGHPARPQGVTESLHKHGESRQNVVIMKRASVTILVRSICCSKFKNVDKDVLEGGSESGPSDWEAESAPPSDDS